MRATGIIRRVDELGRVVIPKEIRRSSRIKEGDPMEIYTGHDGEIIFKKYNPSVNVDPDSLEELAEDRRLTGEERIHLLDQTTYLRRLLKEIEERD